MYRKTININLNRSSIRSAIKELNAYKKELEEKSNELRDKLSDIVKEYAEERYSEVASDSDGWSIQREFTSDGVEIHARGKQVAFIEFGTGLYTEGRHPKEGKGFWRGSWSTDSEVGKGHWDSPHGWWTPEGKHTYGYDTANGIYGGRQKAEQSIEKVAREVFG